MQSFFSKITALFARPAVEFEPIDPFGDGLGDEIIAEQNEPQATSLTEYDDGDTRQFWRAVEEDLHSGNLVEFSEE